MSAAASSADLQAGFCPLRLQRLVDVLQDEIYRARLPGAVALVSRHGQTVLCTALGVQDPATQTPMTVDSIFRIYSMTKPLVSVAVMMLVERGRVLLSDPVEKYLPEYARIVIEQWRRRSLLRAAEAIADCKEILDEVMKGDVKEWLN